MQVNGEGDGRIHLSAWQPQHGQLVALSVILSVSSVLFPQYAARLALAGAVPVARQSSRLWQVLCLLVL